MRVGYIISGILLLTLLNSNKIWAQQDSQYTQYMYNTMSFNPAYAGSRNVLSAFGLYRSQWVGLEGAPITNTFAVHAPVGEKVGLGLSFDSDKIGPMNENTVAVDFSYTIETDSEYKVAFGVRAAANLLNVDFTKLTIQNPGDSSFQNNIINKLSPNIGAGVFVYSDRAYLGLSVPNFLETKHYDDNDAVSVKQEEMHFYLMGGYVFDLNYNLKFKPAVLVKAVIGAPIAADISANFLYNDLFTLGAAYRLNSSFSFMAGFQISEGLFAGYAYDSDTTKLTHYNGGSHEIFLRFELFRKFDKILNPRFF